MKRFKRYKKTISLLLCFIILVVPTLAIADSMKENDVFDLNLLNQDIEMNNLTYTETNDSIIYHFNDNGKEYKYIEKNIDENTIFTEKYVLVEDQFKLFDKITTKFDEDVITGKSQITDQNYELNLNKISHDLNYVDEFTLEELKNNSNIMQKDIDMMNDGGGYYDWIYLSSYEDRGKVEYWTPRVGAMGLGKLAGYSGGLPGLALSFFLDMVVMFSTHNTDYAYTTVFLYKAAYGTGHRQSTYYWLNPARTQPAGDDYWHERYY